MHENAIKLVKTFIDGELKGRGTGSLLEVGSYDKNGSYRPLFPGFSYFGLDIREGPGVDMVVAENEDWDLGRKFDVVLCGQCLEHVRRPWRLMRIIGRHMKRGALLYLAAPFCWPHHSEPKDFQRFTPDGLHIMLMEAGCRTLRKERHNAGFTDHRSWYEECIAVGVRTS